MMSWSAAGSSLEAAAAWDEAVCKARVVTSVILTYPNPASSFCNPAEISQAPAIPRNLLLRGVPSASGGQNVGCSLRSARRRDLAQWGVRAVGRCQGPCADSRAALRLGGVRGRARLWRGDLQAA